MEQKRIGIIGTGATAGIANFHAQGFLREPRAEITAVYDINKQGAAAFVAKHGLLAAVCESYDDLLTRVDGVIICTPNHVHLPYVLGAIDAGRAFLVEKPLAPTLAECEQALAALREKPVFNMVGFVCRFINHSILLKRLVAEKIGRVYTFDVSYGGTRLADPRLPIEWRMQRSLSGSGALTDFGSHLLDLAQFLCGISLGDVACSTATFIPTRPADAKGNTTVENDDAATFFGTGNGGELCTFLVSRVGMDAIHLCIAGEGGILRADFSEGFITYRAKEIGGAYTGAVERFDLDLQKPFDDWFALEATAFTDGLLGLSTDTCSVEQAVAIEQVLETALTASTTGCAKPVSKKI